MKTGVLVLFCLPFMAACAAPSVPVPSAQPRLTVLPESGRSRSTTVYQCGEERLVVAAWIKERVTVHGTDFAETLGWMPPPNSGHYRNSAMEFWVGLEGASFIYQGLTRTGCVRLPEEEPWEAAKLAGASFRAAGHDRGEWSVENGYKEGLVLRFRGQAIKYPRQAPSEDSLTNKVTFGAGEGENSLLVEASPQPCKDPVTGTVYESTVRVDWGDVTLNGCGKILR
jgi:putative lipoprotein